MKVKFDEPVSNVGFNFSLGRYTSARRELAQSKESAAAAQTQLLSAHEELRSAREAAAKVEAHFDKELTTAKRLSDLYKKQAEGRGAKATELEGVLQALRDHLSEVKEEAAAVLTAEKQGKEAAEKALGEAKAQLDRTMR